MIFTSEQVSNGHPRQDLRSDLRRHPHQLPSRGMLIFFNWLFDLIHFCAQYFLFKLSIFPP